MTDEENLRELADASLIAGTADLALSHEVLLQELADDKDKLAELAILHDKELTGLRAALPAIKEAMALELAGKVTELTAKYAEDAKAELIIKSGVLAKEGENILRREVASRTDAIREAITATAEKALAALIVTHEGKLEAMRPHIVELAREAAAQVTKEYAKAQTGLPDLIKKALAALPSVGVSLVRANKGNWKDNVIYDTGDIIAFRGSSYLVLRPNKRGEFPTTQNQNKPTATYQILAAAGSPGPRGTGGDGGISAALTDGHIFVGSGANIATDVALSGDATLANTGALTLATVNSNVGSFGSATQSVALTVNAKGLVTAASHATITPAVGSITGLGTGVATALAVNVGSAGAFVTFNGALGTPSSGTVTNLTGTASININGTVGATTPNTGAFTTLNFSSYLTGSGATVKSYANTFDVYNQFTTSGTSGGASSNPVGTYLSNRYAGGDWEEQVGIWNEVQINNTSGDGNVLVYDALSSINGAGSPAIFTNFGTDLNLTSTGSVTGELNGFKARTITASSSGDITGNIFGLNVASGWSRASAALWAGVFVDNPTYTAAGVSAAFRSAVTSGTNKYSIYTGTAESFFGGEIRSNNLPGTPYTGTSITLYRDASAWGYFNYGSDANLRVVFGKSGAGSVIFGTSTATDNTGTFTGYATLSASLFSTTVPVTSTAANNVLTLRSSGGNATNKISFGTSGEYSLINYDDTTGYLTIGQPAGRSYGVNIQTNGANVGVFTATGLAVTGTLAVSGIGAIGAATSSTTNLNLAASTTGVSSIRIPHGSAPSSPVNGDMWTTTAGLYVRINGATIGPLS